MIPARYNRNMLALEELLTHAEVKEQDVLLYIPPIRTDVAPPYDPQEYADFKEAIQTLAANHTNTHFANLEDIVPGEYWGLKASTDGDGKSIEGTDMTEIYKEKKDQSIAFEIDLSQPKRL